jgi:hypothetical protein
MSPADEDEDEEEEEEAAAPLREARRLLSSPELLSLSELLRSEKVSQLLNQQQKISTTCEKHSSEPWQQRPSSAICSQLDAPGGEWLSPAARPCGADN